ncbi:outer membrane protein assembly factor BamD [Luteimonas sp. 50]|uniref:Outer membrane protein assembly factor BamD n=1 Tax=Cognatiluteimonas sedimenti TaxID=2927791 RepID=A0ABT0A476_9GAMM|nr:outer membrane protein assembly factor BamD [Lysobacter sedimenti]MCJ0825771.1 outer membrane protein assembly factor BamD [Lysobacter sedimenti]
MTPRSFLRPVLLLLLVAVLGTSGCARLKGMFKDGDANEGVPVAELYQKGHEQVMDGDWSSALTIYKRLVAQYPYGPYTEQALVETAYAQYKSGKNDDAISTIDRFIRTYPTHRNTVYMYYLRGLVNSNRDTVFLQKVWTLDASRRDLATPQQAYNDFKIVTERYPNSRYAADARQRMVALRNLFARHELDVALYYMRRGAWVAAADRAKYMLETYPQTQYQNDAVATLGEAYTQLGNTALAADARRVLQQNDPQHPWLSGDWPDYPSSLRRLNPFAGDKSALDHE